MSKIRLDDFTRAREILQQQTGFTTATRAAAEMETRVTSRQEIPWSEMQTFLAEFEREANADGPTARETFALMESVIMASLKSRRWHRWLPRSLRGHVAAKEPASRRELQRLALTAPPVDAHTDALDGSLRFINDELNAGTLTLRQIAFLTMLGHIVRWQAIEDFASEWAGHYSRNLDPKLKADVVPLLLSIKFGMNTPGGKVADSQAYRNAIAHGGFRFPTPLQPTDLIDFWTRDSRGKMHSLPPLNVADLIGLYNMAEKRLRMMEVFARVLRAWGRHGAP